MPRLLVLLACGSLLVAAPLLADEPELSREQVWLKLAPHFTTPDKYKDDFGRWPSPLVREDGTRVTSAEEWPARRKEIEAKWRKLFGPTPELLKNPRIKIVSEREREGCLEQHVHLEIAPEDRYTNAYLIYPPGGKGNKNLPGVVVPFYEPETSAGLRERGRGSHDFGWQLAQRGFVTLSIGTPGMIEEPDRNVRSLLPAEGDRYGCQPLAFLAMVAANANTALRNLPEVDPDRVGIVGLSYGGKWTMFASLLDERFACAVWSDPGIVWDETNGNVNYWEPWYLGYDPKTTRPPGIPNSDRPRTGLYKKLYEADPQRDLVEFHALIAPRPMLLSGGTEDGPDRWQALNHLQAVNDLLGVKNHVGLTSRSTHVPSPEALEQTLLFFDYFLKPK